MIVILWGNNILCYNNFFEGIIDFPKRTDFLFPLFFIISSPMSKRFLQLNTLFINIIPEYKLEVKKKQEIFATKYIFGTEIHRHHFIS